MRNRSSSRELDSVDVTDRFPCLFATGRPRYRATGAPSEIGLRLLADLVAGPQERSFVVDERRELRRLTARVDILRCQ